MSPTQYNYLKDYVDEKQTSTAEVHSILSAMLHDFRLSVIEYGSYPKGCFCLFSKVLMYYHLVHVECQCDITPRLNERLSIVSIIRAHCS